MEYLEVIKKRRSIRKFEDKPIPVETVNAIIETARLAPSGGNGQSWQFGVVMEKAIIKKLAEAAGNQMWITTAPVVIALCGQTTRDLSSLPDNDFGMVVDKLRFTHELIEYLKKYPDQRAVSLLFDRSDTMIPGEHIILSVVNYGLSACWVGLLDVRKASEILALPKEYACLFLIPLGYAAEGPRNIKRKAVEEIAFKNSFGNKYSYSENN
jgi:nitroreductase